MDDKAVEAIVSMLMDLQDRENVNIPLYEQQLNETNTAINNLLNAIQQGILTRSTKERILSSSRFSGSTAGKNSRTIVSPRKVPAAAPDRNSGAAASVRSPRYVDCGAVRRALR